MNTRKLALLSTMLIGLGGAAALAQQATDPAQQPPLPGDQTETMQQSDQPLPGAEGDATNDLGATGGIAEELQTPSRSVTTSTEPYTETVLGGMQADEVIGMNVVDANGDNVGSVSDLLITAENRVDRAIIDVGGFLGFGAKPVAIDIDRLTVAEGDGEVVLDVTREELDAMPEWRAGEDGWFTD